MKCMLITAAMLTAISTAVTAQDEVAVPKDALQEMGFLVGNWEAKGTFNGKEISGKYSAQWVPGKHCLFLTNNWTGGLNNRSSAIGGWSPDLKQYVEHWYGSDGGSLTIRYSFGKKKGIWEGTSTLVDKEGKTSTGNVSLEKSDDQYRFRATGTSGEETAVDTVTKKIK